MFDTNVIYLPPGGEPHTLVAEYSEMKGFGVDRIIRHLNVYTPQDLTEAEAARYAEVQNGRGSIWMLVDVEYNATEVT